MHLYQSNPLSGKRDSNSRPQPWQGCALPTELFPQKVPDCMCPRQDSNLHVSQHSHLKRARLPFRHVGISNRKRNLYFCLVLSGKRDSNSRPQPWQGCALPTELFPQKNIHKSMRSPYLYALPPNCECKGILFLVCHQTFPLFFVTKQTV